jgi:hypothetical protein
MDYVALLGYDQSGDCRNQGDRPNVGGETRQEGAWLHGSANTDDPFGVMQTIVVGPELVALLRSARGVM